LKEKYFWEKRELTTEIKQWKKNLRLLKTSNTNLQRCHEASMQAEKDHRNDLQELEIANKKLQEEMQVMEQSQAREKKTLLERNKLLKNDLRVMKRDLYRKVKIEEDLRKKLQAIEATNKELQEKHYAEMDAMQLSHASDMKILEKSNRELKDKLRALVSANTIQGHQCGKQQIQRSGISDEAENSLNAFDLIRILGQGGFGTVILAKRKVLGRPKQLYAIKVIKKSSFSSSMEVRQTIVEKDALMLASAHPFIVTLHSCFQNQANMFFVMDYVDGGDLREQLDQLGMFSERRTQFYAAEIILALQFLHKHGIVHRDLKLENVLVGSDGHCKVSDLGSAKLGLFDVCLNLEHCGTGYYRAPEIFQDLYFGQGVDWWALGIMIYEMLVGIHPYFSNDQEAELNDWIIGGQVVYPKHMSPAAVSLVTKLLMKEPTERLGANGSADTIRKHPFFRRLDWVALKEKRVEPPEKPVKIRRKRIAHKPIFDNLEKPCKIRKCIDPNQFTGFTFINN
jgi:serine/threonine protein kinase